MKRGKGRKKEGLLAKLPPEMWAEIGKRLRSRLDVLSFRSVCKTWRSSLPSPSRFPLRVPPPPGAAQAGTKFENVPFFITEHSYYDADAGWPVADQPNRMLMVFSEVDRGGKFHPRAYKPQLLQLDRSKEYIEPPIPHLSRLKFLCKLYALHMVLPRFRGWKRIERQWSFYSRRDFKIVILSSNPTTCSVDFANFATDLDLSIVTLLSGGKLALLRLGHGSVDHLLLNWEFDFCSSTFEDIISYNGKLFAVDSLGRAFVMDYHSLQMTQVSAPLFTNPSPESSKDMVFGEALGHLYLLISEPGFDLKVYKLISHLQQWLQVEGLGDQVFLFDFSCRFSAPRDLFAGIGLLDLKYKLPCSIADSNLVFSYSSYSDEPDCGGSCTRYITVPISSKPCVSPWLSVAPAPAPATRTPSTTNWSLLAQFENSAFARTNYFCL